MAQGSGQMPRNDGGLGVRLKLATKTTRWDKMASGRGSASGGEFSPGGLTPLTSAAATPNPGADQAATRQKP